MSKSKISKTMLVVILTILGCVIPAAYINIFPVGYLEPVRKPAIFNNCV